jgi:uncharacterized protein YbaP (TraB family)
MGGKMGFHELHRVCRLAAIVALSVFSGAAVAAEQKPSPAMWKLESGGTTVYFLGSMHALPAGLEWKTPVIERVMEEADIFYFEIVMSQRSARSAQGTLSREAYLPEGKTLSGMLSPRGRDDLAAVAKELGLNPEFLDRMRPWAAGLTLTSAAGRSRSFTAGVDTQVAQFSLTRQKTRRYFETAESQVEAMSKLDDVLAFETGLRDFRRAPETIDRMTSAWVKGDLTALGALLEEGMKESPNSRKVILDERNQAWAKQFPEILRQKRTFLVTVGAAHLFGPGSLVELLCAEKLPVERLDTASGRTTPVCRTSAVAARNPA